MLFVLILGALCVIVGGLLFPFHEKVGAQKFHAFAFIILGLLIAIIPFATGLFSFSDITFSLPQFLMILFLILLLVGIVCAIWFFKSNESTKGWISAIAAVVVGIALIATVFITSPAYNAETEVIVAAQLAVESQLKNPSSAEFSPSSETTVEEVADNTYVVSGWVEATNGFGGTIRNNYTVKLSYADGVSTIIYCNIG